MESKALQIKEGLKRILSVEREHLFGQKTGSDSARRRELEKELERLLSKYSPYSERRDASVHEGEGE